MAVLTERVQEKHLGDSNILYCDLASGHRRVYIWKILLMMCSFYVYQMFILYLHSHGYMDILLRKSGLFITMGGINGNGNSIPGFRVDMYGETKKPSAFLPPFSEIN